MNPNDSRDYTIYLNGLYFDTLWDSSVYNDRPEPNRRHEHSLWVMSQLMKIGTHELTITDKEKNIVLRTKNSDELLAWITMRYPEFVAQLDKPYYTRHPHPNDLLVKR